MLDPHWYFFIMSFCMTDGLCNTVISLDYEPPRYYLTHDLCLKPLNTLSHYYKLKGATIELRICVPWDGEL